MGVFENNQVKVTMTLEDKLTKSMKRVSKSVNEFGEKVTKVTKTSNRFNDKMKKIGSVTDTTSNVARTASSKFKRLNSAIQKLSQGITRGALGIMFMGMAMKRAFEGIARSALTAFNKVMESSDMMGTAIQVLGVHWEFLKFTIGSIMNRVLEPMLPTIIEIMNKIRNWANAHPKLVFWVITLGIVLGTLFMVFGQVALGIFSMVSLLSMLGIKLTFIGGALSTFLLNPIIWIIAAFLLLALAIPAARKPLFEMFKNLGRMILNIGKMFIAVFKGDWVLAFAYGGLAISNFLDSLMGFAETVLQIFIKLGKLIVQTILTPLLAAALVWDKLRGTNYASGLIKAVDDLETAASTTLSNLIPDQSYVTLELQSAIDRLLAEKENERTAEKEESKGGDTIIEKMENKIETTGGFSLDEVMGELDDKIKAHG